MTSALPSPRQRTWHQHPLYGFVHFTINTFTDREWGYGDESPELFQPTAVDCAQWVATAKRAGLSSLILTAKHHDGFCLWPTATTGHHIGASPWRDGQGDLVRELSAACAAGGLGFGLYCSPWDRNHPEYGSPAYVDVYHEQWRELLTNYGPLTEIWLDGANGGDGYYGGARERRAIDASTYYRSDALMAMFRTLQPNAIVTGGPGADLRWCGNEHGFTSLTSWATVSVDETLDQATRDRASIEGTPGGDTWRPPEVDVSVRPGWFWHARERPHGPETLFDMWLASVGRGAGMLLNVAPDQRGLIPPEDVHSLTRFSHLVEAFQAVDLVAGRTVESDDTAAGSPRHLVDGDPTSTWTASSTTANIVIDLGKGERSRSIGGFAIEEAIEHGQRVALWSLDVCCWGGWYEIARGTTIGARRIERVAAASGELIRLRIHDAIAPPVLRTIRVFAGGDPRH